MAIVAKQTSTDFEHEPIPAGMYIARCYSMIHVGTNEEEMKGAKMMLNKIRVTWELPTELKVFKEENGEQPRVISKEYTLSLSSKANLRKDLESWRGKEFTDQEAQAFDVTKLLGVPCMINVIHKKSAKGNTYEVISSITPPVKGMAVPDQINDSFEFNYDDKFSESAIDSMPNFIAEKVRTSDEYKEKTSIDEVKTNEKGEILNEDGQPLF